MLKGTAPHPPKEDLADQANKKEKEENGVDWGDDPPVGEVEKPGKKGPRKLTALEKAKLNAPGNLVLKPAPGQEERQQVVLRAAPQPAKGGKASFGKGKKGKGKSPAREKVLVDWHNTLEKDGVIPVENQRALERLLEKAEVFVLSWVGSQWRKNQVMHEMQNCRFYGQLSAVETTGQKIGKFGKASYAHWWGCSAIFDDCNEIILDAEYQNLQAYAIMTWKEKHLNLKDH